ncbi:MAG: NAD(P)/FAD-dependent oxidoreductase [Defluviitaleaceae bacterium]|nr:NAD(P)/FAD-dependent oxidoreductase [Defluviitaleaceae bacterium]
MFDVLIIGGGPAGATAAIYTARAKFETVLIYKNYGALETAERVDNFYGFSKISGKSLVEKGLRQARRMGAKTVIGEVVGIQKNENGIVVETPTAIYRSKTVLLATGANRDTPKIHGLSDLEGRGVSYCAICDGFLYNGKDVAVLGSGAYALHEVTDLLPLASSVTLLTNGNEPSVSFPDSVIVRTEKISEVTSGAVASKFAGLSQSVFNGVTFDTGESLSLSGLFVATGIASGTELARKIGATLNPQCAVQINSEKQTSVQGIWAAGDCTGGLKQIVKAAHEGAEAGQSIIKFLRGNT